MLTWTIRHVLLQAAHILSVIVSTKNAEVFLELIKLGNQSRVDIIDNIRIILSKSSLIEYLAYSRIIYFHFITLVMRKERNFISSQSTQRFIAISIWWSLISRLLIEVASYITINCDSSIRMKCSLLNIIDFIAKPVILLYIRLSKVMRMQITDFLSLLSYVILLGKKFLLITII